MGPSAILSVLVSANAVEATATLSKFDRQLRAVNTVARKGIEARLGGTFNPEAFDRFQGAVARAARVAKDREAFKAELGANFSNRAFLQYERALDKAKAQTKAASEESKLSSLGGTFGGGLSSKLFNAATGVGFGVGAIGYEAIKGATQFQQAMEMIRTQAGASQAEVDRMSKSVLGLGMTTEQGPVKLAKSLYELESVGLRGKVALMSLHASSDLAATGMADMSTATSAVASAMVAWHLKAAQAGKTAATLNAIVGAGKMHMQDLVEAMGTKLPGVADMLGVSLHSVGAALAVFTDAGESAQMAATNLVTPLFKMAVVTAPKAVAALRSIGLGVHSLANDLRTGGINKAIDDLHARLTAKFGDSKAGLNAQTTLVASAFGGSKGSAPIMQLLTQVDRLGQRYTLVGKGISAWTQRVAAEHATAAHRINVAWSMIRTGFVALGTKALPVVASVLGALENFVTQIEKGKGAGGEFANVISGAFNTIKGVVASVSSVFGGFKNVLKGIGVAIAVVFGGPAIIAGIGAIIAAINPVTLAFVAIAAAAALIIDHWKTVGPFLAGVWKEVESVAKPVISWLVGAWKGATGVIMSVAKAVFPVVKSIVIVAFDAIKVALAILRGVFQLEWNLIRTIVGGAIKLVAGFIKDVLVPAFHFVKPALDLLKGVFTSVFGEIVKIVKGAVNLVLGILSTMANAASSVFKFLSKLPVVGHSLFGGLAGDAKAAADAINGLRDAINGVPSKAVDFRSGSLGEAQRNALAARAHAGRAHGPVSAHSAAVAHHTQTHAASSRTVARVSQHINAGGSAASAAAGASGTTWGINPTTGKRVKHSAAEWAKIMATYRRDHGSTAAGKLASTKTTAYTLPSKLTGTQTTMASLASKLVTAKADDNVEAQQKLIDAEIKLEKTWAKEDRDRLALIVKQLSGRHLTRAQRIKLLAEKLADLHAIAAAETKIGTDNRALMKLLGGSSSASATGTSNTFDLAPSGGGVANIPKNMPTLYDVRTAARKEHAEVHHHVTNNNTFHNDIHRDADIDKFADTLERTLGSGVKAHLRAAGMRGS